MHWFIDPIRDHYLDFEGRVTRKPFWYFVLISTVISSILDTLDPSRGPSVLSGAFSLAILLPSIGITARRLHDTGRSGWWQLLWCIPIIGWIVLIVFLAQDTSPVDNAYGPTTKGVVVATPVPPPTEGEIKTEA